MTPETKSRISKAIQAAQMAACVGALIYISYVEGLSDGKASVSGKVGSDLPAEPDADRSAPSPESTSLDGE